MSTGRPRAGPVPGEYFDAQRVLGVVAGGDRGLTAYPLIDPVLIADTTWNGAISSLDATRILQKVAGFDRPEIPPIPQK